MSLQEFQQQFLREAADQFGEKLLEKGMVYDIPTVVVASDVYHDAVAWMKGHETFRFNHFIDITSVDFKGRSEDYRYEVVVHLRSHETNLRVRLKTRVTDEEPKLPTLSDLFVGATWPEREVYDLMGITFEDHPRMTRILNPDDFVGHPLRKDFPVKGLHRGSFPRGTVVSNKRREPVMSCTTKPKPADHMMPNTVWEMAREPMKSGEEGEEGSEDA